MKKKNKQIIERFKSSLNAYNISSDGIDDNNLMLKDLIAKCWDLLDVLGFAKSDEGIPRKKIGT